MGEIITLENSFALGFQTDPPIDKMPRGAARKFVNFLPPGSGAEARKRGGWAYASVATSLAQRSIAWAPFDDDSHLVMLGYTSGANPRPLDVWGIHAPFDATSGVYVSTIMTPTGGSLPQEQRHPPFWHQAGQALIILGTSRVDMFQSPVKYFHTGGIYTTALVGGTPPLASVGASWGDYLILANGKVGLLRYSNRMWFSDVGNYEGLWDTGTSYLDLPEEIIAVVPKGNLIFVFGRSGVHMITGDTPPPGGNMSVRKFAFAQGCSDPGSVVTYKDYVIWANANGVWKSDGSQPVDLAAQGGISSVWSYLGGAMRTYRKIVAGTYRSFLFITLMDSADNANFSEVATFIYDLEKQVWVEWTNIGTHGYAKAPSSGSSPEELFTASVWGHVGKLSGCWLPDSTNKSDAGGLTDVRTQLITGAERLGDQSFKRIRRVFVSYSFDGPSVTADVEVNASLSTFSASASPGAMGYSSIPLGALTPSAAPGEPTRAALFLNRKAKSVQLEVLSEGNAADFRLYALEAETDLYDKGRAGDVRT